MNFKKKPTIKAKSMQNGNITLQVCLETANKVPIKEIAYKIAYRIGDADFKLHKEAFSAIEGIPVTFNFSGYPSGLCTFRAEAFDASTGEKSFSHELDLLVTYV